MKQDITATVLAHLVKAFPQTFVLEKYRPHRPLKVGISADIRTRLPELSRYKLSTALAAYTRRVMYLEGMVAGTARVDLDGNAAGEVSAGEAEHAAVRLAEIMASREAGRAAAAVAAGGAERRPKAPTVTAPEPEPEPVAEVSPALEAKVVPLMRERPVLRLPTRRTAAR
jgi:sRNA-binding protein